jgi:glycosyl transferase family 25
MSPNPVSIHAFDAPLLPAGSKARGLVKGSRLLRPLFAAGRRFLDARMAGTTVFVDEASPYGTMSPQ